MGRIKAKTHLQKLGFSERDKKNSNHDVIQKWAYQNIEKIISETVMSKNPKPYKIVANKWEHQVMHENGNFRMIVGFIDILVRVQGEFYFSSLKEYDYYTKDVFVEIKTQIPNLGELIRQMRAYQTYSDNITEYIIISPDDRHKDILEEQGFIFYKYNDPNLLF